MPAEWPALPAEWPVTTPLNRYALTGGALRRFLVGVDIEPGARIAHEVGDRRDAGMGFYEKHGTAKSP